MALTAEKFLEAERRHGSESVWPYYYAGTMGFVQRDGINRLRHAKKYSGFYATICTNMAWTGFIAGSFAFRLPLMLIGFHPAMVFFVGGLNLIYQFWIHTEAIGRLPRWFEAVKRSREAARWTVHGGPAFAESFRGLPGPVRWNPVLNLDTEIRFHLTPKVHQFVAGLLEGMPVALLRELAGELHDGGHRFLLTRDLATARAYLRDRYADARFARFGLVASSKDKWLPGLGVDNTFQTTKQLRVGPFTFLAVLPRKDRADEDHAAESVADADICRWLDEPGQAAETPRPDESAIFRQVLKMDERSCDAAEQALMQIKKRSSR